jgi:hypothetical protein
MSGRRGEIGIEGGEVRRAAIVDGVSGEDAFYQMAGWKSATFAFISGANKKGAPNITTPTMPLLMEAMRRVDESSRTPTTRREPDSAEKSLNELF